MGLASAAHGGNSWGDWLARGMHENGFASKPASVSSDDGLVLRDAYITALLMCAPPDNKPLPWELAACSKYLEAELQMLKNVQVVVLALERITFAFDAYCRAAGAKVLEFSHGACFEVAGRVACLVPPQQPEHQHGQVDLGDMVEDIQNGKSNAALITFSSYAFSRPFCAASFPSWGHAF